MSNQDDLTKIRIEVNEHRHRLRTVEKLLENQNIINKEQSDALKRVAKGLEKLDKRFTIFIVALVASGVFGDTLSNLLLNFVM